jgi:hypothetical protein
MELVKTEHYGYLCEDCFAKTSDEAFDKKPHITRHYCDGWCFPLSRHEEMQESAMARLRAEGYEVECLCRPPAWNGRAVWKVTATSKSFSFFVSRPDAKTPGGVQVLEHCEHFEWKPYVPVGSEDPFAQLGRPGEGGRE